MILLKVLAVADLYGPCTVITPLLDDCLEFPGPPEGPNLRFVFDGVDHFDAVSADTDVSDNISAMVVDDPAIPDSPHPNEHAPFQFDLRRMGLRMRGRQILQPDLQFVGVGLQSFLGHTRATLYKLISPRSVMASVWTSLALVITFATLQGRGGPSVELLPAVLARQGKVDPL